MYEKIGINSDQYIDKNYKRISWDDYFMEMAFLISKRSHDAQTQVGCCFVRDNRVIATGFNGFPSGSPDEIMPNIREGGYKYDLINHAEESAIFDAARRGVSLEGSKLYITLHPCCDCCRKLVSIGVKDWVVASLDYQRKENDSILQDFWKNMFNVNVTLYKK